MKNSMLSSVRRGAPKRNNIQEIRVSHREVFTMREDYWCFKMKGIIAGVLIVIVGAIALAVTGFIQIVRAWSDIFR